MLQNLINSLNREQLLACLNDPSVTDDVLKSAVMHCAQTNGASATPPNGAAAAAAPAPAKAPKAAAAKAAAATTVASPADAIVSAMLTAGVGFAVADVIAGGAAATPPVTRSQASSAIKRAVKASTCFGAGTRRFTRYGSTEAVALASSTAARG